jgi:hypothetical protein
MSRPHERHWARILLGYLVLLALVVLATAPLYLGVAADDRPLVLRLAAAAVVAIALLHLRTMLLEELDSASFSEFERALRPESLPATLDPGFLRLCEEVKNGMKSRDYFQHILWPRLLTLARQRGAALPAEPPEGRPFRRGPSRRALEELLTRLEERS